jgi:hypothetical protein
MADPIKFSVQVLIPPPQLSPNDQAIDKVLGPGQLGFYDPNSKDPKLDVFALTFTGDLAGQYAQFASRGQTVAAPGQVPIFPLDQNLTLAQLETLKTTANPNGLPNAGVPSGFTTTDPGLLDPMVFRGFHSAFEVKYIQNALALAGQTTTPLFLTLGAKLNAQGVGIHALVSTDQTRVFIIEDLTKADITKMNPNDISLLMQAVNNSRNSANPDFATAVTNKLDSLGLNLDTSIAQASNAKANAIAAIGQFFNVDTNQAPPAVNFGTNPTFADGLIATLPAPYPGISTSAMTADDRKVFAKEAQILLTSINDNKLISAKDISDQLKLLTDRLALVAAMSTQKEFHTIHTNFDDGGQPPYMSGWVGDTVSVVADPNNPGQTKQINNNITNGYTNMMRQEAKILSLAQTAYGQAKGVDPLTGALVSRPTNLDAPALLFQFQLNANLAQEAQIATSTEEVKQLNALLSAYNQMQSLINNTLKQFGTDANEKRSLSNPQPFNLTIAGTTTTVNVVNATAPRNPGDPQPNQADSIAAMFDNNVGFGLAPGANPHPLEAVFGVSRPLQEMIGGNPVGASDGKTYNLIRYEALTYSKAQWTSYNDQISGVVTQLNQQSQILTDSINSLTKQKDRHFDLGNNALTKMSDIIQAIGRGIA